MSSRNTPEQMEQMEIDESTPVNKGFFIKKKIVMIVGAGLGALFIASLIMLIVGSTLVSKDNSGNSVTTKPTESTTTTTTKAPVSKVDYRLQSNLQPYFYELEIRPYIGPKEVYQNKAFTYTGQNKMHFTCTEPTKMIEFHQLDLVIDASSLVLSSSSDSGLTIEKEMNEDKERQTVSFHFNRECKVSNNYTLSVPFSGEITTNLYGFYRSSYEENGKTFYLASTDFEPTDARRAFPCFDEPAMKAKYTMKMTRHKNFTSTLFNTPLKSSMEFSEDPDWMVDEFEETVIMSTYLVAFVISNFEKISKYSPVNNVLIEVAGRPEAISSNEGEFALNEAAEIIDFFSSYFGIKYPLTKSTQVGIPNFNSGAMENWGLVTYRESSLFYNNQTDTIGNKRRVSLVVSHELAHQWYGNLVTMAWWNDLWLNEGFASWVENLGLNHTHPEWRDLDYFFVKRIDVMVKDSLESSHPVSVEVNNPQDIGAIFDKISYDKGASVVRMMNGFLTEPTFQKGVNEYLHKYAYANTEQDDLWESLTKAGHEDKTLDMDITVKQIMDTWTLQMGYPVVQMAKIGNKIKVSQERFLLNPMKVARKSDSYKWYVPITYVSKSEAGNANAFDFEKRPEHWLKNTDSITFTTTADENDWIIGNLGHASFHRVNYDENNWKKLQDQLNTDHLVIDATSRAALLDDSFNLGRAEIISQNKFLEIASYLNKEEDPLAFSAAFPGLEYINNMLVSDLPSASLFKQFYTKQVENTYLKLGWNETLEDSNEIDLQTSVLKIICRSGYQECINKARRFYSDWMNLDKPLPTNFKGIILSTVIEYGSSEDWQQLYERALRTTGADKLRIFLALARSKDFGLLKFFLEQTSNEAIVKRQDELTVVGAIANNAYGNDLVFDYLDQNWDLLMQKYGDVSFTLPRLVESVTSKLNTRYHLEKIQRFIRDHPSAVTGVTTSAFNEAQETVGINVRWAETNFKPVVEWLEADSKPKPEEPRNYRLQKNLVPQSYTITVKPYFKPHLKPEYYDGKVEIKFKCATDTSKLELHYNKLELVNSSLKLSSSTDSLFSEITDFEYTHDPITQIMRVENVLFKAGNEYTFNVDYKGFTVDDNLGFYRSKYEDNGEKWIIASQLETVEARKSFPCFDEPEWKATFNIILIHDSTLVPFSNMPQKSSKPLIAFRNIDSTETIITESDKTTDTITDTITDTTETETISTATHITTDSATVDDYNWMITEFDETLTMSTYLVAIVLADYKCISSNVTLKEGSIQSSVCARPNAYDELDLASQSSVEILQRLEEYYNVSYPFPKLDHVATPTFKYGAMENWGLAIYLERFFLKNSNTSQIIEQRIVSIITHEIAHMWFGNLVTPKWWDDLWLNEGFARYMEHIGTALVRPQWNMLDQLVNLILGVFHADAAPNIRAISLDANTPEEIDAMVDPTITYGKGSAIVRMLNYILGEDTFNRALTAYFNKFAFQNVDQMDLWTALETQGKLENKLKDIDLADMMKKWTTQAGHPVITVNVQKDKVILTQNPFKVDSLASLGEFKWSMPFTYSIEKVNSIGEASSHNVQTIWNVVEWFKENEESKTISFNGKTLESDNFILANLDVAGYFRVNYDENNWKNIVKQLDKKHREIPVRMKAQLINDAFDFSQATLVKADLPLEITKFLSDETDYLPWSAFLSRFKFYKDMLDTSRLFPDMETKMSFLIEPMFNFLGFTQDNNKHNWVQRMLRSQVIDFACEYGVTGCVDEAKKHFNEWSKDTDYNNEVFELFKGTITCIGVKEGGKNEFNSVYRKLDDIKDDKELTELISQALSCTKDQQLIIKYLFRSKSFEGNSRIQAIRNVAHNPYGNQLAWKHIKENWIELHEKSSPNALSALLAKVTTKFNTQEQFEDFNDFFKANSHKKVFDKLDELKDKMKSNINWFVKSFDIIEEWLLV